MRYLLCAATAALLPQASGAQAPGSSLAPAVEMPRVPAGTQCRKPTSHKTESDLVWRDAPLTLRKLDELPPAQGYMAVYRTVNGCETPMTIVEYREGSR